MKSPAIKAHLQETDHQHLTNVCFLGVATSRPSYDVTPFLAMMSSLEWVGGAQRAKSSLSPIDLSQL